MSRQDVRAAGMAVPVVHPDVLAGHYGDMYTRRDRVEHVHPAAAAV